MATVESEITVIKSSPASREDARGKANFDSAMVILRHECKWADTPEAVEYFYRELKRQVRSLESRLKGLAIKS